MPTLRAFGSKSIGTVGRDLSESVRLWVPPLQGGYVVIPSTELSQAGAVSEQLAKVRVKLSVSKVLSARGHNCSGVGSVGAIGACVKSNIFVRSSSSRRADAMVESLTGRALVENVRSMNCRIEV